MVKSQNFSERKMKNKTLFAMFALVIERTKKLLEWKSSEGMEWDAGDEEYDRW